MSTAQAQTPADPKPSTDDPIIKFFQAEPHRAYTAEDVVKALTPQLVKDAQKKDQAVGDMASGLRKMVEGGRLAEIADGLFKSRLFFDKEQNIEHAFVGGMGNTQFRFQSPIFRLNIGVLSLYFTKDMTAGTWRVTVRDTTIGKDYSLLRRLPDGTYVIGSERQATQPNYIQIEGKYIAKKHLTITLAGDTVSVEDHQTLNGTRIDCLTKDGLARYQAAAREFLGLSDAKDQRDPVKRGRFALERLLQQHQNFETSFFGSVVDSLLLAGGAPKA